MLEVRERSISITKYYKCKTIEVSPHTCQDTSSSQNLKQAITGDGGVKERGTYSLPWQNAELITECNWRRKDRVVKPKPESYPDPAVQLSLAYKTD